MDNIETIIVGRTVAPPFPVSRAALLPAEDPADELAASVPVYLAGAPSCTVAGLNVWIAYTDALGQRSERRVTCRRKDADLLFGYCHERQALRRFRIDRISALVDPTTGEVFGDVPAVLPRIA